jgi:hypothetical protein
MELRPRAHGALDQHAASAILVLEGSQISFIGACGGVWQGVVRVCAEDRGGPDDKEIRTIDDP